MKVLGWEIIKPKKNVKNLKALVPSDSDGGYSSPPSAESQSSFFSFDQNSTYTTDIDLITKYRNLTFIPEVDLAIEEIINEMIISSENDDIVILDQDKLEVSDQFKVKINNEFRYLLGILNFQDQAYDYARKWYIDGRIFFHDLIDMQNPRLGIQDIRLLDSLCVKKVKEVDREFDENQIPVISSVREYFIYNELGIHTTRQAPSADVIISADSISYSTSGLIDPSTGIVISNLHKALKIANHLSMIETALVIYRLTRAPERRAFYIDTGDLPKQKAEEYLREQMTRHRNKLTYDVTTGQLMDQKSILSMMEDYWFPRRGGTRGTEVTTLESGQNLQNIEDVIYFREKLYKSLNVPLLRLQADTSYSYSKDSAIIREELKFSKFIDKLRKKFSFFLYDLLRKQLILKNIISPADWEEIKQSIFIKFQKDSFYTEMKELELFSDRISLLNDMNAYVGTLFSNEFVYKNVLNFTNTQIDNLQKELVEEKKIKSEDTGQLTDESESGGFNDFGTTDFSMNPGEGIESPPPEKLATSVPPENPGVPGTTTV